jgi:glycosyltransferase involved in cell wall biosynthesis
VPDGSNPKFSIVVPAYNAAGTLAETLDAVLAQRHGDWECVVVDDGSVDATLDIARSYERRDSRIRVIPQANAGTAGAYNTAVAAANGEYVVLCSADDILLPEHLATFSAFMDENPGFDIYSSNGFYWRPDEGRDLVNYDRRSQEPHSKSLSDVIRVCFYSVGAVFRRGLFVEVGGYRLGVFGEDYDFWLRSMARGARHRYLPAPLSLFRVSATQKSSNLEAMYRSDIALVSELRESYPLSDEERRAVAASIQERERLIDELHSGPLHAVRNRLGPIAVRLVGRKLARRSWHVIRAVARATVRR